MAGYSSTTLAKKLGIKPGAVVQLIDEPGHYLQLFSDMPDNVVFKSAKQPKDLIHFFVKEYTKLEKDLVKLKGEIKQDGIIWVSWLKKSAKIPTDVTEDKIRNLALSIGLVDIKVCAVDDTWSGLKLVIPVKDRVKP